MSGIFGRPSFPTTKKPVTWVSCTAGQGLPEHAIVGCTEPLGFGNIYIARAKFDAKWIPGFTTSSAETILFPYGCVERTSATFEVLTCQDPHSLHWVRSENGNVPRTILMGGTESNSEITYIGRTCTPLSGGKTARYRFLQPNRSLLDNDKRIGKIHPSHQCLYICYNGNEFNFPTYEALCQKESPGLLLEICKWKIRKKIDHKLINKLPLPGVLKRFLEED